MNPDIKAQVYELHLKGHSGKTIAKRLNLSEATVSRALKSVVLSNDYQLGIKTASMLIQDYIESADFFKLQKAELDELLKNLDGYLQGDGEDEKGRPIVTRAECMKIRLQIMEMMAERQANILTLVRQGQLVQALQAIRDGKLAIEDIMKKLTEEKKGKDDTKAGIN